MRGGVLFGLSLATSRAHIVRALTEGAAYGLRHNVDVAEESGVRVCLLRSVGGGSRSTVWSQIKADVLVLPPVGVSVDSWPPVRFGPEGRITL